MSLLFIEDVITLHNDKNELYSTGWNNLYQDKYMRKHFDYLSTETDEF